MSKVSVDTQSVIYGEWVEEIHIDDSGNYPISYPLYRCSQCGELYEGGEPDDFYNRFFNYCPNCGVKMNG